MKLAKFIEEERRQKPMSKKELTTALMNLAQVVDALLERQGLEAHLRPTTRGYEFEIIERNQ